ncbi:FCA [Symbiodinium sp. CCMP2592]|nr:FCA [Symbiodinium sp. CCMP2592]
MRSRAWSASPPRRRRRRRRGGEHASRSGGRHGRDGSRSGGSREPSRRRSRSRSNPNDRRPWIEREKGGVKLFVGRLPREVNKTALEECFGEFGEVLEVFIIASQAASGVGCSFVRMASIQAAEEAIAELHEQRVLIPEQADLGPMQVAFAKGEAIRLGLDEKEEILPSFKEARQKVVEHQEKKHFFEKMQKQQEEQAKIVEYQHALMMQHQAMLQQIQEKPREDLVTIVKDGQRNGGQPFKQRWWSFCDAGWSGCRDYDPNHHGKEALAHFVSVASTEYGHEQWFKSRFPKLPALPEKPKGMPEPGSPGLMPPGAPPPGGPPHGPPGPGGPGLGPRPPMGMGPGGPIPGPPGLPPHLPPHLPPPGMPGMPLPGMPGSQKKHRSLQQFVCRLSKAWGATLRTAWRAAPARAGLGCSLRVKTCTPRLHRGRMPPPFPLMHPPPGPCLSMHLI